MSIIGYIRVGSLKQTLEHQRFEIENFVNREGLKTDQWVEEKISSRQSPKKRKLGVTRGTIHRFLGRFKEEIFLSKINADKKS